MKDRPFKVKSPWMKYFVIDSTPADDLTKSRLEARSHMIDKHIQGRSTKREVIK